MLMEFCVDFGAYRTTDVVVVLVIMLVLTPHYFAMGTVFRLWYRWFTFTPREAFFAMGTAGFVLETFILPVISGTFQPLVLLLSPIYYVLNALNYGGFVVIATLHQNQGEKRAPILTWKKYLAGVGGTLAIMLPVIIGFYTLLYSFHLW
jgi:hypothetical protein